VVDLVGRVVGVRADAQPAVALVDDDALGPAAPHQAALCEGAELHAWLLAHAGEDQARRERAFFGKFFDKPLGPKGLKTYQAVFDAGTGPEYYVLSSSGWEDWFDSWTGAVVREVAPGWYIEWPPPEGAKTLPGDCLMSEEAVDGRAGEGHLSTPEDYEEAQEREAEEDAEGE
jgi:hypothetical protein